MYFSVLLKWIIIGFCIAAPVGPVWALCINRTLCKSRLSGFLVGLGAVSVDLFYWCVAIFWLSFITDFLLKYNIWLKSVGAVFLIFLGIKMYLSNYTISCENTDKKSLLQDYLISMWLTIINPATIISFGVMTSIIKIEEIKSTNLFIWILILGFLVGSILCWTSLSLWAYFLVKKAHKSSVSMINKIMWSIIIILAIIILYHLAINYINSF